MSIYIVERCMKGRTWRPILNAYQDGEIAGEHARLFEKIAVEERLPDRFRAVEYVRKGE